MVKLLSDLNKGIQYVPVPQSPDRAGMIKLWGGSTANIPNNWFICNGQAVSRTVYPNLFAALGTKYGVGDGSTTFNLPNGPFSTADIKLGITAPDGSPTLPDSFILQYAQGRAFATSFGEYYLTFWIKMDGGFITNTFTSVKITGVEFWNPTSTNEMAVALSSDNTSPMTTSHVYDDGAGNPNLVRLGGEGTHNTLIAGGTVKLAQAPIDSFVAADTRFTTFNEALQNVPIIKAFDDSDARVAVSTVP